MEKRFRRVEAEKGHSLSDGSDLPYIAVRNSWCFADRPRVFGCFTMSSAKEVPGTASVGSISSARVAASTSPILMMPVHPDGCLVRPSPSQCNDNERSRHFQWHSRVMMMRLILQPAKRCVPGWGQLPLPHWWSPHRCHRIALASTAPAHTQPADDKSLLGQGALPALEGNLVFSPQPSFETIKVNLSFLPRLVFHSASCMQHISSPQNCLSRSALVIGSSGIPSATPEQHTMVTTAQRRKLLFKALHHTSWGKGDQWGKKDLGQVDGGRRRHMNPHSDKSTDSRQSDRGSRAGLRVQSHQNFKNRKWTRHVWKSKSDPLQTQQKNVHRRHGNEKAKQHCNQPRQRAPWAIHQRAEERGLVAGKPQVKQDAPDLRQACEDPVRKYCGANPKAHQHTEMMSPEEDAEVVLWSGHRHIQACRSVNPSRVRVQVTADTNGTSLQGTGRRSTFGQGTCRVNKVTKTDRNMLPGKRDQIRNSWRHLKDADMATLLAKPIPHNRPPWCQHDLVWHDRLMTLDNRLQDLFSWQKTQGITEGMRNVQGNTISVGIRGLGVATLDAHMGMTTTTPDIKEKRWKSIDHETKLLPVNGPNNAWGSHGFRKTTVKEGAPRAKPAHFAQSALLTTAWPTATPPNTQEHQCPKSRLFGWQRSNPRGCLYERTAGRTGLKVAQGGSMKKERKRFSSIMWMTWRLPGKDKVNSMFPASDEGALLMQVPSMDLGTSGARRWPMDRRGGWKVGEQSKANQPPKSNHSKSHTSQKSKHKEESKEAKWVREVCSRDTGGT